MVLNDIPVTKDAAKDEKKVEDSRRGSDVEVNAWKMTDLQKRGVRRNWAILSRDVSDHCKRIFFEMFRRDPELKNFFTFANLNEDEIAHVRKQHRIYMITWR